MSESTPKVEPTPKICQSCWRCQAVVKINNRWRCQTCASKARPSGFKVPKMTT